MSNDANSTTTTVSINLEKGLQSVTNQPTRVFLQQNLLLDRAQVEFRPGEGVAPLLGSQLAERRQAGQTSNRCPAGQLETIFHNQLETISRGPQPQGRRAQ